MPKYKIQKEAFDNQNLARSAAFGRDRDVQMQEENIDAGVADAIGDAKDVTSSSSALLSTLAMLEGNKNQALRGLAQDESGIRRGNRAELYAANNAMIDEKDKAWRQNKFAPWEAKLQGLREKQARRAQLGSAITGGLLSAAGTVLGGPVGGEIANKIAGGRRNTTGVSEMTEDIDASLNGYNPYMPIV